MCFFDPSLSQQLGSFSELGGKCYRLTFYLLFLFFFLVGMAKGREVGEGDVVSWTDHLRLWKSKLILICFLQ